ncbi:MAG: CoA-acylating methylmalonate-semialdehyde dehydrogenase [Firmicutes bacterium]|nr:CoA-acylating methylmalonate-semialdehyde dehydrogenase [Alicyclobacillaceae bacterium]MCL6496073.1 CoA-acylating methylmalonate-semialdehyde dehydrogenase [Bacillota bacterium]
MRGHIIKGREVWDGEGQWPVFDPARGEVFDAVPQARPEVVEQAVAAAVEAGREWARVSTLERVRLLFRYKAVLEEHFEELAALVTHQHGKTLEEARGEVRRGLEVVDFACGAATHIQGRTLPNVGGQVDQLWYRQPVGVVACITPFNFPVMIPLWMVPLAVVMGNTVVLKPSERTPLGAVRLAELALEAGIPAGVINVVHGDGRVVNQLVEHPAVAAVSFVGSAAIARRVYETAAQAGKRVQAAGGAKNHLVVMPDADWAQAVPAVINSAFGNAGERCLAGSVVVAVGEAYRPLLDQVVEAARRLKVGPGDEPGVDVGPLIRAEHRDRVCGYIAQGEREGARVVLDGRPGYLERPGFFLGPTILDAVTPSSAVGREEIFGPVLSVMQAESLEEALRIIEANPYGNMAAIFTQSGRAARRFREGVQCGMVGVNVGVAQPLAYYPFSGWRESFFGDLHLHGPDGVEFYTRKKVVVERW